MQSCADIAAPYKIYVRKAELCQFSTDVHRGGKPLFRRGQELILEQFIFGEFRRFNSNTGWTSGEELPDAFSHWTWQQTKKKCLVCDLQGCKKDDRDIPKSAKKKKGIESTPYYLFTDPAINSSDKHAGGIMDLGDAGIETWFYYHKCNSLCKRMGLDTERWINPKPRLPVMQNSSYGSTISHATTVRPCARPGVSTIVEGEEDDDEEVETFEAPHSVPVHEQNGGTCYAHACATVLRAGTKYVGRATEKHDVLVVRIVATYGENGGHCHTVLDEFCPRYGLQWTEVEASLVDQILNSQRVLCASFALSENQWKRFVRFFMGNPSGKLAFGDLGDPTGAVTGHAIVLIGHKADYWKFKNSWGEGFADDGYFRIAKDAAKQMGFQFLEVHEIQAKS